MKLLVVGARPGSLGAAVAKAGYHAGFEVTTAGNSYGPGENLRMDLTQIFSTNKLVERHQWDHVVCTAGVNLEGERLAVHMEANFFGPMNLLDAWVRCHEHVTIVRHFVAISSNSAHIARSGSVGYCASKAALSMGIRCVARAQAQKPLAIYAYEPGWLSGTPMSQEVATRLSGPSHRIPSGESVDPAQLAEMIITNIVRGDKSLNGCTLRVDGGEQ